MRVLSCINAIFDRQPARSASSEVVPHLVRSKCIPVLLYGLDACPINATDFKSLQHPITNIFMTMFATKSAEVVTECQQAFGFQPILLPSDRMASKVTNFEMSIS